MTAWKRQIKEKRVADSLTEQFHEIRPEHLNGADVMFGGILMGWIERWQVLRLCGILRDMCSQHRR